MWLLIVLCFALIAGLGYTVFQRQGDNLKGLRWIAVAAIQAFVLCLLLVMLWRPALRVTALKPQQNVIAVVVDDSRSMLLKQDAGTRVDAAKQLLNSGLLDKLKSRFQVRVYRAGANLERIQNLEAVTGSQNTTHLGGAMKQMMEESASLPIGAVVLLTDGSDNAGGLEADTLGEIRRRRIPIHTVGFGAEQIGRAHV